MRSGRRSDWTRWVRRVLAAVLFGAFAGAALAQSKLGGGRGALIVPLRAAPVLDGKLELGEWDFATGTVNFMNFDGRVEPSFNGMHMDPREGRTLVGYHGNTLYIAVVSSLPPRAIYEGGKHSRELGRDAELIGDFNAIEIWLDPNRDRRESREGDQAFYQVFVNSVGSLYDAKLVPGSAPEKGWNTEIRSAHHIDEANKIWTAEMAIDMSNFPGWDGDIAGKSMGILVARNYKAPWQQGTWFPHGGAFVSWQLYPQIRFEREGVVTRIESVGDEFWEARPLFDVKLFNAGAAREVKVNLHIQSSTMPDVLDEQVIALPADGVATYRFGTQGERLHNHADHLFHLAVTPKGTEDAVFRYAGMWSRDPRTWVGTGKSGRWSTILPFEQKWSIRAGANPAGSVSVVAFPYLNTFRVSVDASLLVADPGGADKDKLSDSVLITVARDEKQIAREELSWDLANQELMARHLIELDKMEAGEYTFTFTFNRHADPIVKKYTREVYEWEGNTVGITDTIYPPFEAVVADAGSTKVVGREYGVGDLGLWSSVKSLGKEILAGPIVLKADGERVLTGKAKLVESKPMLARYEAQAADEAVTVTAVTTTEIDGVMKLELTLKPGTKNQELSTLVLDIPLKVEHVPLWHAVTTAIRVNPMGYLPEGEGVVWDNNRFPNGDWPAAFVPYLWLGGVERGLCYFASNDKGWVRSWDHKRNFAPAQQLIRQGDTVILRLNLVQKPITIEEPRTITLGLMASPGKPIPEHYKNWRAMTAWHGTRLGEGLEWMPRHNFAMGFAVESVFASAYPIGRDYSIFDARAGIAGTPGGDLAREKGYGAFLADWKQRHGLDKPQDTLSASQRAASSRSGSHPGVENYNSMYWDEYHNDWHGHPETRVFNGEWRYNMAQSRRDFRCWYGAEVVKRGVGLYFDNVFPHRQLDPLTSDAYEIPGVGMQPSSGLWEQRDYHRRLWNIHREYGARWNHRPMQALHMTNTKIIPFLTWADMTVDLEWFYGPEPQQSKYGLPMLQAETSGRQSGCVPVALANIENTRSSPERRIAERTKFGAMMVHEVRISYSGVPEASRLARILHGFGYGRAGVFPEEADREDVYNYWQDDNPVASDQDLVKTLLVRRDDELLLLAVSWDQNPLTTRFTFDTTAIGVTPAGAVDAEGTVAEQLAEYRERIAEVEANLVKQREELARTEKGLETNPESTHHRNIKGRVTNQIKATEAQVAGLQAILPDVESTAAHRIAHDAGKKTLTVDMEGYGVRLIRLK